jgi:1,4-alpha-glucan branching enzyme
MNPHHRRQAYHAITRPIVFHLNAPKAHKVSLTIRLAKDDVALTHPMHKGVDGVWSLRTELARGRYVYRFLVDGAPALDSSAHGSISDEHGGHWSTREIGY